MNLSTKNYVKEILKNDIFIVLGRVIFLCLFLIAVKRLVINFSHIIVFLLTTPNSNTLILIEMLIKYSFVIISIIIAYTIYYVQGIDLKELLNYSDNYIKKKSISKIAIIVIFPFLYFSVFFVLINIFDIPIGYYNYSIQTIAVIESSWSVFIIINLLFTIAVTPIFEETLFRGVILKELNKIFSNNISNILQSILFVIIHGLGRNHISIFVFGFVFGAITLKFKSIKPAIYFHIVHNITVVSLLIIQDII